MRPQRDRMAAIERRRNQIRTMLFIIILGTLPFYPIGIWLWATAPDLDAREQALTQQAPTNTVPPIDITATDARPSLTPRPSWTPSGPLQPTPIQIFPRNTLPVGQPTFVILPSATTAPTLTTAPTFTPLPSFTPLPTFTPIVATNTLPPTETQAPMIDTPIPPPSDTPGP